MATNVSIWIRAFRLPLQRTYPRLEKTPDAIDSDFADLLRRASERLAEDDESAPCDIETPRPAIPHKTSRN